MGNGALRRHKKYEEPYPVDATPKTSAHDACSSMQSKHGDVPSLKLEAPSIVVVAPHGRKSSKSSHGRKSSKESLGSQNSIIDGGLDGGLAGILDPARLQRQSLTELKSSPRLKSGPSHIDKGIEGVLNGLIDTDDMAAQIIQQVDAQLLSTLNDDLAERRSTFRSLCFQWHASHHTGKPSMRWAGHVHQHLMEQRDWYLAAQHLPPNLAVNMEAARRNLLGDTYGPK